MSYKLNDPKIAACKTESWSLERMEMGMGSFDKADCSEHVTWTVALSFKLAHQSQPHRIRLVSIL